jgi:hypothetical protein
MALRTEIQELVDEITGENHPEEAVFVRLAHAAVELIDVMGEIVRGLDEPNKQEDLEALSNELIAAANQAIDKLLGSRPARAATAKMVAAFLIPTAVLQLGVNYSGNVEAFRVGYLYPVFRELEAFGHRGVVAFGGG